MGLQALALAPGDRQVIKFLAPGYRQVIKFLAPYDRQVIKMSRKLVSVDHDRLGC